MLPFDPTTLFNDPSFRSRVYDHASILEDYPSQAASDSSALESSDASPMSSHADPPLALSPSSQPLHWVCSQCGKAFRARKQLNVHRDRHTKPWKCSISACSYHEQGFGAKKDLMRHQASAHKFDSQETLYCPDRQCSKTFPRFRDDNLRRHVKSYHPHLLRETSDVSSTLSR